MGNYSLAESPTGLIHYIQVLPPTSWTPNGRGVTHCGREVDFDRWMRIRTYDQAMFGKGPRAIRAMIDSANICDKCFPR